MFRYAILALALVALTSGLSDPNLQLDTRDAGAVCLAKFQTAKGVCYNFPAAGRCKMLYCAYGGQFMMALPAGPAPSGTSCGDGKICRDGNCVVGESQNFRDEERLQFKCHR